MYLFRFAAKRRGRARRRRWLCRLRVDGVVDSNHSRESFDWLWSSKKPGPLPEIKATATPRSLASTVGKAGRVSRRRLRRVGHAGTTSGTLVRIDRQPGSLLWPSIYKLSAGVGADQTLVAVVPTRARSSRTLPTAKPLWQSKVTSEILSPPKVAEGIVVVWSGDGKIFGLSGADADQVGHQRTMPPLTVPHYAGTIVFSRTPRNLLHSISATAMSAGKQFSTPKSLLSSNVSRYHVAACGRDGRYARSRFQGRIACLRNHPRRDHLVTRPSSHVWSRVR